MPVYKCSKCDRTVEKPVGNYYCMFCGPSAIMEKVALGHRSNPIVPERSRLINESLALAKGIFGNNLVSARVVGSLVSPYKPFRPESDIDVEVWLKDARWGSRQLSFVERFEPSKLMVDSHKVHFLIREQSNSQFEEFLRKVFVEAGYPGVRVEKRTEKTYDVILFYETSHPSWVFIDFLNEWVDVHFSYAIKTPHIPEAELKRIFGFKPKEHYTGYVYARLKAPILVWANVWSDEMHVHHRAIIRDYELKTYLPMAVEVMKRIIADLKRDPKAMIVGRPSIYRHEFGPYLGIAVLHPIHFPEEKREVYRILSVLNAEAKREWLTQKH